MRGRNWRKGLHTAERAEVLEEMAFSGYIPTFKERHSFAKKVRVHIATDVRQSLSKSRTVFTISAARAKDAAEARQQQPNKIPVVIERFEGEKYLPLLDRCKFLVPDHITVAGLMQIVRRRLQLHPDQTFFLLVNEKSMVSNSMNMHQLYQQEADQDGFLYMVYTSQPAFGSIK
ncbi:unnamed protein product [Wuchereria bancrofti]|uniref:Uncharacterized protein n=3 Tax=Wuchereria bancrofti TaxID=6293 RepID=A0A3P7DV73_WUCBA|nr:unnamed protein product [Wuchereria bancrofti]